MFKKYINNINNLLNSNKFCISKPSQLKKVYLKLHPDKTTKYSINTQYLATELFKKLQQKEAIYYQKTPCNIDLDIYNNKKKTPSYIPHSYTPPLRPIPKNKPPPKDCLPGKIRNPKTGRCINDKTKNKTKKNKPPPKDCLPGKIRNPKTGRCINDKTKKNKPPPKDCPPGKIRNPKTGRCINDKRN